MKTMKFSIKVLMAMLLFCLPFAITSCGSDDDDDDNTPKTYTYTFTIESSNPVSSELAAIETAYNSALKTVGTIDGNKLKVTATSVDETKAQVNVRIEKACLNAYSSVLDQYATGFESKNITVRVKGNGLDYKQEFKK